MSNFTLALLFCAGVVGGIVNALAGGATLITFPAMLHAGLPPVIADASNAVAILPGHLFAAIADRQQIPPWDRRGLLLAAAALSGGAAGAIMLLVLPEAALTKPIPILIAFATLLFGFAPRLQASASARARLRLSSAATAPIALGLCSIYGGFFGAGLGVLLTGVLSLTVPGSIRSTKASKNLLATFVSIAAATIFILKKAVSWPATAVMLGGAVLGGLVGGHLIRVLPAGVVRGIVIVAGVAMSVLYAERYWF